MTETVIEEEEHVLKMLITPVSGCSLSESRTADKLALTEKALSLSL